MAGSDSQKQLLTLIRDFASEKSQGERRVAALKKQIEQLTSELDASNAKLEEAKRCRDSLEQELKGYEVELSLNESAIQALEGRLSSFQDVISIVSADLDGIKSKEMESRDEFISKMLEVNKNIRKLQQMILQQDSNGSLSGKISVTCMKKTVGPGANECNSQKSLQLPGKLSREVSLLSLSNLKAVKAEGEIFVGKGGETEHSVT